MCSFCCYNVIMSSNVKRSNILMCFVPAALRSGKVWSEAGSPTQISASCWSKPIGGKPYQPSTSTLPRWTIIAKPIWAHKCTKKVAHIKCALYSKSSKAWKSSSLKSHLIQIWHIMTVLTSVIFHNGAREKIWSKYQLKFWSVPHTKAIVWLKKHCNRL